MNPHDPPQVAVLIVCHNGRRFLHDCLTSVLSSDDGDLQRHVIVVDNASIDGSADFVAETFPKAHLIRASTNSGFAGGNNLGWRFIRTTLPDVEFIALLNQDTIAISGWLGPLVEYLDGHPIAGAVQSKVLLHPETHLLNTAGNASHFLGFGFTTGYRQPDDGRFDCIRPIDFASGAAMMVRVDALRDQPLFDDIMFAYLEDAELSWRLRQMGYRVMYVPRSVVQHKYTFAGDYRHYYTLERNRWWLLGIYYRTGTLLLILPALLAMEGGQVYFSWRNGVLREKLRAWRFFLCRRNVALLMQRRRAAQHRRVIGDRAFVESYLAEIDSPELKSRLLSRVANPLLKTYWRLVRALIAW